MDQSRRTLIKSGLATVAGALGIGAAARLTEAATGSGGAAPASTRTLSLHGASWRVTSPARQAGEFPDSGEQMLVTGDLYDRAGGDKVGEFYATYLAVAAPGRAAPDGAASLQLHTVALAGGTILGSGTATPGHDTVDEFAVIGGTGEYANARGTYTARQSHQQFGGDGTASFDMTLVV
ncbi:MAG TPA: dirigent protein [Acidimicrobiales bacterium]|nr:dirigent protein [Acidimicrobiales bacterium]